MNKILVLKGIIAVITLLIILCMIATVYGLVNYKKTPKLISHKIAAKAAEVFKTPEDIYLEQKKGSKIGDVTSCGSYLCVRITTPFTEDRVAVMDVDSNKLLYWIHIGAKPAAETE